MTEKEKELFAALARLSAAVDAILQGRPDERELIEAQAQAKLVLADCVTSDEQAP